MIIVATKPDDHEMLRACRCVSPLPAVLPKGPLDPSRAADPRPNVDSVRQALSGARTLDQLTKWGERVPNTLLAAIGLITGVR